MNFRIQHELRFIRHNILLYLVLLGKNATNKHKPQKILKN